MGSHEIPCPNVVIYRKQSGHAHAVFSLRKPVFRGERARPFPLAVLARCSEWLLAALHADAGFTGVLVSNPTHQDVDAEVVLARVLEDGEALAAHVLLRGRDPQIGVGDRPQLIKAIRRAKPEPRESRFGAKAPVNTGRQSTGYRTLGCLSQAWRLD